MRLIKARAIGELSDSAVREQLRRLDRRRWLELNSSWTNYALLDLLLEEYPRAKFVLTIRDCYSWLDSIFNEVLARGRYHSEYQVQFQRWYAESLSPGSHQDSDRVLEELGLWPLDFWLRAWNQHNAQVLALVPADRLFVVRTQDIRREIPGLAEFLGLPPDRLQAERSHEHTAAARFGLVRKIDESYLQARAEARCAELMKKFFPEIRCLSDAPGFRSRAALSPSGAS